MTLLNVLALFVMPKLTLIRHLRVFVVHLRMQIFLFPTCTELSRIRHLQ